MTRKQKNAWMFYIISNDKQSQFNFNDNFFELDWYRQRKLDQYADLFGIRESGGKSRARKLWDRVTEYLPF